MNTSSPDVAWPPKGQKRELTHHFRLWSRTDDLVEFSEEPRQPHIPRDPVVLLHEQVDVISLLHLMKRNKHIMHGGLFSSNGQMKPPPPVQTFIVISAICDFVMHPGCFATTSAWERLTSKHRTVVVFMKTGGLYSFLVRQNIVSTALFFWK